VVGYHKVEADRFRIPGFFNSSDTAVNSHDKLEAL
jgi:hypothetical protein